MFTLSCKKVQGSILVKLEFCASRPDKISVLSHPLQITALVIQASLIAFDLSKSRPVNGSHKKAAILDIWS